MKLLLLIAVVAALTMASPVDKKEEDEYDWESFKIKFNRNYSPEEDKTRKAIFDANVAKIKEHNKKYENKEVSYSMGVNNFADKTPEESRQSLGLKKDNTNKGVYTGV
ncbi:protein CTLA-2-alpha [Nilaparvata lugens]|uniref:protein CTLA-2-alpha n=1 Tax=Nilaparvata lugens TaxID=108931 RepID=UPI000B99210F|nr:protein CTLA-2-alpha [Nilaparvata lugens]XP_022197432.1 protein CTLA-2-alpha [Nilaparvata lugens]XP_022197439.1 protein CTLA-2-alpha [Nilaparvata lugens]XP_039284410.1 protein CTLA-2-alpha [Nilaparvata lugens]